MHTIIRNKCCQKHIYFLLCCIIHVDLYVFLLTSYLFMLNGFSANSLCTTFNPSHRSLSLRSISFATVREVPSAAMTRLAVRKKASSISHVVSSSSLEVVPIEEGLFLVEVSHLDTLHNPNQSNPDQIPFNNMFMSESKMLVDSSGLI